MSKPTNDNNMSSPLYAVIDLGSNSFHMLITRQLADSVQVVDKVKRKVRLASGLDKNNNLSEQAMARGLECLSFFAERLQDIPEENIRIVATATLRLATNRELFISRANKVLNNTITLLSGEQEAAYIYQGVAYTNCSENERLVVDIGGASTELIVGVGTTAKKIMSLDLGCVTFNNQFFNDGQLTKKNFELAIAAASKLLSPHVKCYTQIGWQTVLGGSGTMQALAEMLLFDHQPSLITKQYLYEIQQQLINCQTIGQINLPGLNSERIPVIASGLSILIAIFECFSINQLQLSSGALREGLLYEMLPCGAQSDIRQRTINSLMCRYHVDQHHAENIKAQATSLFSFVSGPWGLSKDHSFQLLIAACQLHEIGLLLEFKHHQKHSAYIIENAELPGFDQADRQLLAILVRLYKGDIDSELLKQATLKSEITLHYLIILRLAVILCRRRKDDVLPEYELTIDNDVIQLTLPKSWLGLHPLIADELTQEDHHLKQFGLSLAINTKD